MSIGRIARQSFDPAHTGTACAVAKRYKHANVTRLAHMRAPTKF